MHSAIDIRMLACLVTHQAIDHWLRHLAGGCIIEVDQWFSFDLKLQNWKIGTHTCDVERRINLRLQRGIYDFHGSVFLGLFQHCLFKPVFEGCDGNAINDLGAKRISQQIARRNSG